VTKKLDLKVVLSALDSNDYFHYDKLPEDEQKGRYKENQLISVNEIVNVDFNVLKNHKKLQWMLLADCGLGSKQYHPWIAPPKGQHKTKNHELLSKMFPFNNAEELDLMVSKYNKDGLLELMLEHGIDDKEIEAYFS
jgi:hypothetical protein